ncbi:hypothetical protein [Streptomyces pseudovenezuelae]|uniref:Uncharacterized protein n=1 Tax=Streptomyces pseudovenezuelae TaxID=67350 RepID=A0ABT6M2W3_9ACTN|nr:hypothetical protein [Streptomyces pseudovenezuelae]MDH6222838.1 hypothetical protein [Streptomyces pseudovenezuelae]
MTTPAAVAARAAKILGGVWQATAGPWEATGHLNAPETDTYTLDVEDGELRLTASLDPGFSITFLDQVSPSGYEVVAETIADEIRQHHTTAHPDK